MFTLHFYVLVQLRTDVISSQDRIMNITKPHLGVRPRQDYFLEVTNFDIEAFGKLLNSARAQHCNVIQTTVFK